MDRHSILLVGDNALCEGPLAEVIKDRGDYITRASSPEAVIGQDFDLILTNLSFPMPPHEAIEKLKDADHTGLLVVARQRNGHPVELSELATSGADFIFDSDLSKAEAAWMLDTIFKRVRPKMINETVSLHSRFSLPVVALNESHRSLAILESLEALGLIDRKAKLRLLLAYQEALANAVDHGCLELPSSLREQFDEAGLDAFAVEKDRRLADATYSSRTIVVESSFADGVLVVTIEDSGKGFLPAPVHTLNDGKLHGRGLGLLRTLMDEVSYSEFGRVITMKKRITSDAS